MKKIKSEEVLKQSLSDYSPIRDPLFIKTPSSLSNKQSDFQMKTLIGYQYHNLPEPERQKQDIEFNFDIVKQKDVDKDYQYDNKKSIINNDKTIGDPSYDIWDLTYTMINSKIPIALSSILFILFLSIRYYTLVCLLYITSKSNNRYILWILVIILNRLLYMILVIKISLEAPQTKTQIILKSHWNSKQCEINQLFQAVDFRKLVVSIIRGLIPAELAFIYIRATPRRKFELYAAINYINSSIQAILYYPLFIADVSLLDLATPLEFNKYYQMITIAFAVLAEVMILILSLVLFIVGIKRKYGKILFCFL